MARTIIDIQNEVYAKIAADPTLPSSISKSAMYRIFTFIICYAIWIVESLFDTHKQEVDAIIEAKMPHRPSWYRTKALEFQYGFNLITDTDNFDNTGYTAEQIEASKIIKYCAVPKGKAQKYIKIATEVGGVLSPINDLQKAAFQAFMDEISDWGVDYFIVNNPPDILLLDMDVYVNPLVLNANGMSIVNGNYPIQDAILEYMKNLPFNGELVLFDLGSKIKSVDGVDFPGTINAQSQINDIGTGNYLDPQPITEKTVPESGYFTIPNFNNIRYVVQS